jgi:hypothetical protein
MSGQLYAEHVVELCVSRGRCTFDSLSSCKEFFLVNEIPPFAAEDFLATGLLSPETAVLQQAKSSTSTWFGYGFRWTVETGKKWTHWMFGIQPQTAAEEERLVYLPALKAMVSKISKLALRRESICDTVFTQGEWADFLMENNVLDGSLVTQFILLESGPTLPAVVLLKGVEHEEGILCTPADNLEVQTFAAELLHVKYIHERMARFIRKHEEKVDEVEQFRLDPELAKESQLAIEANKLFFVQLEKTLKRVRLGVAEGGRTKKRETLKDCVEYIRAECLDHFPGEWPREGS